MIRAYEYVVVGPQHNFMEEREVDSDIRTQQRAESREREGPARILLRSLLPRAAALPLICAVGVLRVVVVV